MSNKRNEKLHVPLSTATNCVTSNYARFFGKTLELEKWQGDFPN